MLPTSAAKLVVLTPVKNEEWILERFLTATSQFADVIIVADQYSTDGSRDICRRFSKVILIENPERNYNEEYRQRLLIAAARRAVPGPRVLLALDADEIVSADTVHSAGWASVKKAPPGTVLRFPKPDILGNANYCRPSAAPFALGYVDDGREHEGLVFHSQRLPGSEQNPKLDVEDICFLHFGMAREHEYFARVRLYCVQEKLARSKSWKARMLYYSPHVLRARLAAVALPLHKSWLAGWDAQGIDLRTHPSSEDNHFNRQVLELFAVHGESMFWWDDIWEFDWERYQRFVRERHPAAPNPEKRIRGPGRARRIAIDLVRACVMFRERGKG